MEELIDYSEEMEEQQQQQVQQGRGGWGPWGSRNMAMDVDDEAFDMFGDGPLCFDRQRLSDTDFYNSFDDDFDDHDIN